MGNSASSSGRGHHDETVDYGYLVPQGVYTGPRDWNQAIVNQFICERRLAPFYRPLEDYEESWDDDQILAARKELPDVEGGHPDAASTRTHESNGSKPGHHKRSSVREGTGRCPEALVYRGAVECPICFLYYPPNINHSRCCDQAICTECFVQIKRAEPTTTHIVSEPAACPYCVQDNFGVVYTPPLWRAGIGSEGMTPPWPENPSPKGSQQYITPAPTHKRRQKSFSHDSPEVVTTDHIRPDWEAKLAAVRAAVARRANRRIIMRQVGDRLIPVGVTSGRVHALPIEDGQGHGEEGGGSRRLRRRQQGHQDLNQFLGLGGQDLEELMVMEAMRLSLLEHEEQQRKEKEAQNKVKGSETTPGETGASTSTTTQSLTPPSSIIPQSPSTGASSVSGGTPAFNEPMPTSIGNPSPPTLSTVSVTSTPPLEGGITSATQSAINSDNAGSHDSNTPNEPQHPPMPLNSASFTSSTTTQDDSSQTYQVLNSASDLSLSYVPLVGQEHSTTVDHES